MTTHSRNEALAVVGATVIDGNGGTPIRDGVILIEGGRITSVGGPATSVPSNALMISANGKFVMPGMMDANVHLFFTITPDLLVRYEGQYLTLIHNTEPTRLGMITYTV